MLVHDDWCCIGGCVLQHCGIGRCISLLLVRIWWMYSVQTLVMSFSGAWNSYWNVIALLSQLSSFCHILTATPVDEFFDDVDERQVGASPTRLGEEREVT